MTAVAASTIIKRAVRLLTTERVPTSDELADGLEALNARLDSLRNEKLFCVAMQTESLTLVNGQYSYQIGPSGDLNTTRPVEIADAWITDSTSQSYGVLIISAEEYDAVPDKTSTANWPRKINYRPTGPTGTLLCWRVPTQASTLNLLTRVPVLSFASTSSTVELAPGWQEMLSGDLAIVLAPEYDTEPRQSILQMVRSAKQALRTINSQPFTAATELPYLVGRRARTNIYTDQ